MKVIKILEIENDNVKVRVNEDDARFLYNELDAYFNPKEATSEEVKPETDQQ